MFAGNEGAREDRFILACIGTRERALEAKRKWWRRTHRARVDRGRSLSTDERRVRRLESKRRWAKKNYVAILDARRRA